MGIREQRKAETARQIQAATLDLVEDLGYEVTTVAQIAARAGISERTFFRYFESKESAIAPGQRELIAALVEAPVAAGNGIAEVFQTLLQVCRNHFSMEVQHHEVRRIARLMLSEPKLLMVSSIREQELVAQVSQSLMRRGLLERMEALLVAEMLAATWRVSWQCFAHDEQAGSTVQPAEHFEKAAATILQISAFSTP